MLKTAVRRVKKGFFVRPSVRRGLKEAGRMVLYALLTRLRTAGGLSAFAPACFAAELARGRHPACMLSGCALGILTDGFSTASVLTGLSCALLALMHGILRRSLAVFPSALAELDG